MGHQAAGWFLLAGFLLGFAAFGSAAPRPIIGVNDLTNKQKVRQKINSIQLWRKMLLAAIALQIPAIFQGIYLIGSGYESFLTNADPDTMGRTAARGRGRGGIVLLIIQFFPYFLIGGYGFIAWEIFANYRSENDRLRRLQTLYSYLSDRTADEIKAFKYGLLTGLAKYKVADDELFASQLIGHIIETKKVKQGNSATQTAPQVNQEQPRFARDVNLQTQPVEQTSGVDAEKPIIKEESGKAQSEEVDTLEKELEKAERLKERGLISEEEYQALRKKALGL